MESIWIFHMDTILIARCSGPVYRYKQMDVKTGEMYEHIIHGVPIQTPKWDWIGFLNNEWFAKFNNSIYLITDIYTPDSAGTTPVVNLAHYVRE